MTHRSKADWHQYVNEELSESKKQEFEEHLYGCDECMDLYLQVIEESNDQLPDVGDHDEFTDVVLSRIEKQHGISQSIRRRRPFYEQTVFHYVLAATLTIVLMTSGVFQSITNYVDDVHQSTVSEETPSITEQIINRAFSDTNREK
ncbi:anti-sigma factor family protein [Evansella halocellulosilytica]|uniref:anti-sigma factor family protein n=1 Tax=Evansella halocellulosilytica TaxID=2011013 RepID=UPI000BB72448|nr:hypothetical protein [Evansella halocellulosilytica]